MRNALPGRRGTAALVLFLLAGFALRVYFVGQHAFVANDSILYQEIAHNWLHAHVYGFSTDAAPRPTLIRLPGYPAVLLLLEWLLSPVFRPTIATLPSFLPVIWLQVFADMGTCWMLGSIARQLFGRRAQIAAVALYAFCPFAANYTAVPLTETITLFTIAAAYLLLVRWNALRRGRDLVLLGITLAFSALLRPDGGLLAATVLPAILVVESGTLVRRLRPALVCTVIIAVPFAAWTVRNERTFHVFQPLAPRLAADPGEAVPTGFQRWFRTWGITFNDTLNAYWNYPDAAVPIDSLPARAFDSPAQRQEVDTLLQQTNTSLQYSAANDAAFAHIAAVRIHEHPLRYYLALPFARLADMLLQPRIEMLPINEPWWQQPRQDVLFCIAYALVNLAYLLAAALAVPRCWRTAPVLTACMLMYVLLRCALLLTVDNAEQRYTVEFFPIAALLASALTSDPRSRFSRPTAELWKPSRTAAG